MSPDRRWKSRGNFKMGKEVMQVSFMMDTMLGALYIYIYIIYIYIHSFRLVSSKKQEIMTLTGCGSVWEA